MAPCLKAEPLRGAFVLEENLLLDSGSGSLSLPALHSDEIECCGRPCNELRGQGHEMTREEKDLYRLAGLRPLRRWASNWVRLTLCLIGSRVLSLESQPFFEGRRRTSSRIMEMQLQLDSIAQACEVGFQPSWPLDFDSTLGFPGEGPLLICNQVLHLGFSLLALSTLGSALLAPFSLVGLSCSFPVVVEAMPLYPRNPGDFARRTARSGRDPPVPERTVLPVTQTNRDKYLQVFGNWLTDCGIDFYDMLEEPFQWADELNMVMVRFGRELYQSGRPYSHFVETINAITAKKPLTKRLFQIAWNYAFNWVRQEPSVHHVALPFQVLAAMLVVSLTWGWDKVAGALALMWGSMLRAGEFLSANRRQLLLPRDVRNTVSHALFSIPIPKTRTTAAQHQAAKLDVPDLLQVCDIAFGRLQPDELLWPMSGQSLRTRFKQILLALGLPTVKQADLKPLDLGSLRAGGATWTLTVTENSELTRRRGRWISSKTMEIYIQETMSLVYLNRIKPSVRDHVLQLATFFPAVLERASLLSKTCIAPTLWYNLFKLERDNESDGMTDEVGRSSF